MTNEVSAEVRELAAKTAAELRRRGRIRGHYWDPSASSSRNCGVCLLGAINAVTSGHPGEPALEGCGLKRQIDMRVGTSAARWNDDPLTTDDDVLNLLDSIAAGE